MSFFAEGETGSAPISGFYNDSGAAYTLECFGHIVNKKVSRNFQNVRRERKKVQMAVPRVWDWRCAGTGMAPPRLCGARGAGYGTGVMGLWPGGCPAMGRLWAGYGMVRNAGYGVVLDQHIWCALESNHQSGPPCAE